MACLNTLKLEIKTLERTFTKSHERFQIINASVDELTCRFVGENGKFYDIHANITVSILYVLFSCSLYLDLFFCFRKFFFFFFFTKQLSTSLLLCNILYMSIYSRMGSTKSDRMSPFFCNMVWSTRNKRNFFFVFYTQGQGKHIKCHDLLPFACLLSLVPFFFFFVYKVCVLNFSSCLISAIMSQEIVFSFRVDIRYDT